MIVMEFVSKTELRVRYAETDRMGIVHHSRYYPWFEIARGDFIRQSGVSYQEMEAAGILLPLTETGAKYIEGLKYDEEAVIDCRLAELSVARCTFTYAVYRKSDYKLMVTGVTKHGFVDGNFRPMNLKKKHPDIWNIISELYAGGQE